MNFDAIIPRMTFQESLAALHDDRRNVAIFDIAATFAIMGGAIYLLVRYPGAWSYALAFTVIGLMQYRIVMACHEAVHRRLLFPLWFNETAGSAHCALVGINLLWYRRQHLGHHAAQDVGHDTDAYIYEPILRARPGMRRLAIWIFGTAGEVVQKIQQKGFTVSATIEAEGMARFYSFAIVGVQALLLVGCAIWLSWWYYFVFWLAPLLTIAIFMNRTRVLVEHGYTHVPRPEGSLLTAAPVETIDLSAGFLGRFFVAPYMFNYHFSHHTVPSIPYYKNPDLSRLLEQHGKGESSARHPTYSQALRHVLWG
jgi:fatty acid desaturase